MAMNPHQLLNLLLPLLLVVVMSLPSTYSSRSSCDISAARRDAQSGAYPWNNYICGQVNRMDMRPVTYRLSLLPSWDWGGKKSISFRAE